MKRVIIKTAVITLGVVIVLAVAAFGIASFCLPAVMSDFTYSLGMNNVSSDYAYQEYEISHDLNYLSRAFELAAHSGRNEKAKTRFEKLYADEGFSEMCAENDVTAEVGGEERTYSYRDYMCGLGACVMYRLAQTPEEDAEAIALAVNETAQDFPAGNPAHTLAVEAAYAKDEDFCTKLLSALRAAQFDENEVYTNIVTVLGGSN